MFLHVSHAHHKETTKTLSKNVLKMKAFVADLVQYPTKKNENNAKKLVFSKAGMAQTKIHFKKFDSEVSWH